MLLALAHRHAVDVTCKTVQDALAQAWNHAACCYDAHVLSRYLHKFTAAHSGTSQQLNQLDSILVAVGQQHQILSSVARFNLAVCGQCRSRRFQCLITSNTWSMRTSNSAFPGWVLVTACPTLDASKQLLRCVWNVFDCAENVFEVSIWADHLAAFCGNASDRC